MLYYCSYHKHTVMLIENTHFRRMGIRPRKHTPCISCKMRIWPASFPFNQTAQQSGLSAKVPAGATLSYITMESCAGAHDSETRVLSFSLSS